MKVLRSLLGTLSVSHFKFEKLKGLLTILGMTLGVAVYAAIRLASQNVNASFEVSVGALAGNSSSFIVAKAGRISETWMPALLKLDSIEAMTPQSTRVVQLVRENSDERQNIQVIGTDVMQLQAFDLLPPAENPREQSLDLLAKDGAAGVSQSLSDLQGGKNLNVYVNTGTKTLLPVFTLPDEGLGRAFAGLVAVMDMGIYQDFFEDYGQIDRLLIKPREGVRLQDLQTEIETLSARALSLSTPESTKEHGQKITEAFNLNLQFLACISLLVGVLLIYNSVSYAVLKRRKEIGILRSLGAKSKDLFQLVVIESLGVGVISSSLGIALGFWLSKGNVELMSASISNLYFPLAVREVAFNYSIAIECFVLGCAMSVLGSVIPCFEIFKIEPRESFFYQNVEDKFTKWIPKLAVIGVIALALTVLFAQKIWLERNIMMGFLPPFLLILGFVCLVPLSLKTLINFAKRVIKTKLGVEIPLALDHIQVTLQRNTVAVASAMIAIGMYLGMSVMISSFRGTVNQWIEHVTTADLFISSPYPISGRVGGYLNPNVVDALKKHESVKDFDSIATIKTKWRDREIKIAGIRYELIPKYNRLLFKDSYEPEDFLEQDSEIKRILISETFSNRFGVSIGDQFEIPGLTQNQTVEVMNVFYDYSSDQGVLYLPHTLFEKLYSTQNKQGMALYLKEGVNASDFKAWIQRSFPGETMDIRENTTLRKEVMTIFDQTFQITYALQLIALVVAGAVILNTILMLTLERSREFGVLRAIGAKMKFIIKMMITEALLLGAAAFAGGVVVGLALAVILVFVINKFFFGWSVAFELSPLVFMTTGVGVLALSFFAGLFPGLQMSRSLDAKVLRYE